MSEQPKQPLPSSQNSNAPLENADPSQPPKSTNFLNLPQSEQMIDRAPSLSTHQFTDESRFELRFSQSRIVIKVKKELVIGRLVEGTPDPVDVDLTPEDAYKHGVSRRHAVIRLHDGALYIQDLKSTNGTRINGSILQPDREYRLRDGDELEFARIRAVIHFLPATSTKPANE